MDAFGALADPTRRRVVELLARRGTLTAGQLVDRFESARPTISRHLRALREAGIVRSHAVAQERHYSLEPASLGKMEAWLSRHRRFWAERLSQLERHLEKTDDLRSALRYLSSAYAPGTISPRARWFSYR